MQGSVEQRVSLPGDARRSRHDHSDEGLRLQGALPPGTGHCGAYCPGACRWRAPAEAEAVRLVAEFHARGWSGHCLPPAQRRAVRGARAQQAGQALSFVTKDTSEKQIAPGTRASKRASALRTTSYDGLRFSPTSDLRRPQHRHTNLALNAPSSLDAARNMISRMIASEMRRRVGARRKAATVTAAPSDAPEVPSLGHPSALPVEAFPREQRNEKAMAIAGCRTRRRSGLAQPSS